MTTPGLTPPTPVQLNIQPVIAPPTPIQPPLTLDELKKSHDDLTVKFLEYKARSTEVINMQATCLQDVFTKVATLEAKLAELQRAPQATTLVTPPLPGTTVMPGRPVFGGGGNVAPSPNCVDCNKSKSGPYAHYARCYGCFKAKKDGQGGFGGGGRPGGFQGGAPGRGGFQQHQNDEPDFAPDDD